MLPQLVSPPEYCKVMLANSWSPQQVSLQVRILQNNFHSQSLTFCFEANLGNELWMKSNINQGKACERLSWFSFEHYGNRKRLSITEYELYSIWGDENDSACAWTLSGVRKKSHKNPAKKKLIFVQTACWSGFFFFPRKNKCWRGGGRNRNVTFAKWQGRARTCGRLKVVCNRYTVAVHHSSLRPAWPLVSEARERLCGYKGGKVGYSLLVSFGWLLGQQSAHPATVSSNVRSAQYRFAG